MKNITLAIDERILDQVREIAARRRTTVNALVRDYLTQMASEESRITEARRGLAELMEKSTGRLGPDYVWDRGEIYEERMFPRHQRSDLRSDGETGRSAQVPDRRSDRSE
jgi:predicted transcriptional regulator